MDLTKLYNLTTPELRTEAERLGVPDTYALSRAQLIHSIRGLAGGPKPEGFFGRMLGFAKWALQPPQPAPAEATQGEHPVNRGPEDTVEIDLAEVEPVLVETAAVESTAAPEAMHFVKPSDVPSSAPSVAPGAFTPGPTSKDEAVTSQASSTAPSHMPAGVFSRASILFEEPFPTLTMARILAEQGHFKRSLAIYANLLRDTPNDSDLRGEADQVRTQSRERQVRT